MITSEKTSRNQLPTLAKKIPVESGNIVFDFGCGKYSKTEEYFSDHEMHWLGYDPYNRSKYDNQFALVNAYKADFILCANVLNVTEDTKPVINMLYRVASESKNPVYLSVYEGNRTGKHKVTRDGYQRNELLEQYIPDLISSGFKITKRTKSYLIMEAK